MLKRKASDRLTSYRASLSEHGSAKLVRKGVGRYHIDRHAEQLPQFKPNCTNVEERRLWCRIDDDVKVAAIGVVAMQDGTEHTWVSCPVCLDNAPNTCSVRVQGFGGPHAHYPSGSGVGPRNKNERLAQKCNHAPAWVVGGSTRLGNSSCGQDPGKLMRHRTDDPLAFMQRSHVDALRFACERIQVPVVIANLDLVVFGDESHDDGLDKTSFARAFRAWSRST